ncbi:MAG: hypothetical protein HN855_10160 [Anaerolineae bacterium]|jgi:hypothetical protein|nr:hypothetical protein [Anaerolineae bacterium]MBT7071412.1 hypothetical protein [Anaerolineae bacterium]MBT7325514.1 hypothetical protein [Anaerolineae bacterium]
MTTQMQTSNTSIRPILYANAIFSGISGLIFTFSSKTIAAFLGIASSSGIVLVLGIVLMVFADVIYIFAKREEISKGFVLFAIIADSLWVFASILLLLTSWVPFTAEGKWAVGIIAIIVDIFAALQFFKWQKMK